MIMSESGASGGYAILPVVNHMLGSMFQLAGRMTAITVGGYYGTQAY
jgi:hypothetical protein